MQSSWRTSETCSQRDDMIPEGASQRLCSLPQPFRVRGDKPEHSRPAGPGSLLPMPAPSPGCKARDKWGNPSGRTSNRRSPVRQCFRRHQFKLGLALAVLAVACAAPHQYRYDYALKTSGESAKGIIENDRLRVQVAPTKALGVVHVAVTNKSLEPAAVAWQETYFVNPHGHRHQAVDRNQAVIRAPDASMREGGIAPGATWRGTMQPGGAPASTPRQVESSRYEGGLSPVDRQLVLNPLTVTVYEGGEMTLGSAAASFLPGAGSAPELAEAYRGKEFHLVLGLQAGAEVISYRFDFVITDVQVVR